MSEVKSVAVDRLSEAFSTFEAALQELLVEEARRSVDRALERLTLSAGSVSVSGVEVDVVVRKLTVAATPPHGDGAPSAAPRAVKAKPRARAKAKTGAPRRGGRPAGPLRTALLQTFSAGGELSTDQIRQRVAELDVKASDDNLHQQLRRLVAAGEIDRVGRGRYAKAG